MLYKSKAQAKNFATLMDTFCRQADMDPMIPDAQGRYSLELNDDDRPIFCFDADDGTGIIHACVIEMQPAGAKGAEKLMDLLSGFTGFLKSRHDVLCLDKQENEIVLFRRFSLKTATASYLYAIIEDFVNGLCTWRSLAASGAIDSPAGAGAKDSSEKMLIRV